MDYLQDVRSFKYDLNGNFIVSKLMCHRFKIENTNRFRPEYVFVPVDNIDDFKNAKKSFGNDHYEGKVMCYRFKYGNREVFVPENDIDHVEGLDESKVLTLVNEEEVNLGKYGILKKHRNKRGGSRKRSKTHKHSKCCRH